MNYFTADIHFSDPDTMKCDNRPFKNIKSFDNFIIKDWNKTAKKGDTIYVVGDMLNCNGKKSLEWVHGLKLIKKVKASLVLIIGNNEQRIIDNFFDGNFNAFVKCCQFYGVKEVYKKLDIKFRKKEFCLVHQIVHGDKNKINLFGHTHLCSGLYHPYGLCVSTDLNHFRLFSENQVFLYLKRKVEYWEPDGNTNYINPFIKKIGNKYVNIKQKSSKTWQKYMKDNQYKTNILKK